MTTRPTELDLTREGIARMRALERKALLEDVMSLFHGGTWHFGEVVRFLRAVVLKRTRQDFARLVGLSLAALQKLEDRPDANPTLDTMNRVLKPFGGSVGIVFPRMELRPPPSEETRQRQESLRAALRSTRRRRAQ